MTLSKTPDAASTAATSIWTEHKHKDGRVYWYNPAQKRSVWEKPHELKTDRERAIEKTDWKVYKSGERSYYFNTNTQERTWTLPAELRTLFQDLPGTPIQTSSSNNNSPQPVTAQPPTAQAAQAAQAAPTAPTAPTAPAAPAASAAATQPLKAVPTGPKFPHHPPASLPPRPMVTPASLPPRPPMGPGHYYPFPVQSPTTPQLNQPSGGFAALPLPASNAAEEAFMRLLQSKGVAPDWTWEHTMRNIVTEPLYKSLSTMSERKVAFHKYVDALRVAETEQRAQRVEVLSSALKKVFGTQIQVYHSYDTAQKLFGHIPPWNSAANDQERREAFDSIIRDLKHDKEAQERQVRESNLATIESLFRKMNLNVFSRWRDVYTSLIQTAEWNAKYHDHSPELTDVLDVFESRMREIESDERARRRAQDDAEALRASQTRMAVSQLFLDMHREGKIHAGTSWSEIYPLIKEDPRIVAMLHGQAGSTPLDLFYDLVDDLDARLDAVATRIGRSLSDTAAFVVSADTQPEEFEAKVNELGAWEDVSEAEKPHVLPRVREFAARKQRDEQRKRERALRHQTDDLRYALRRVDLKEHLNLTVEQVGHLDQVASLPAWTSTSEEVRQLVWTTYVQRTQEQLAKAERERAREREREQERRQRDQERRQRHEVSRDHPRDARADHHPHDPRDRRVADRYPRQASSPLPLDPRVRSAWRAPPPPLPPAPMAGIGYNGGIGPRRLDYEGLATDSDVASLDSRKRPAIDDPPAPPRRTKVRYGDDLEEGQL